MRGKIIKFASLTRRRRVARSAEGTLPRKNLLFRLLNKTAAPFWFARLRKEAHHRYRDWVALRMQLVSDAVYRVDVRGRENFTYQPSTIIASGHKRDMDIPILVSRFYWGQKPVSRRRDLRRLYVATRDDVFERGFLTVYFPLLDFMRPVLAQITVGKMFSLLQSCPVKLPDEQTVNQLLQETCRIEGNLPLEEALGPEWQERLVGEAAGKTGLRLRDAIYRAPLATLSQYATARMFREPLATRIRQRHAETMVKQLKHITRVLEKGNTLLVLPEGQVTPDGRFCKMRAAITRLVLQTRAETRLLPVNLTYDFMDTARPSVTMRVGPEIQNLKHMPKNQLTDLIRVNVAGLGCVSLSGLASRWLVVAAGKEVESVTVGQFREELWAEVQRLRELGLALDRQLATRQEFEERFNRFLKYTFKQPGIFRNMPQGQLSGDTLLWLDLPGLHREECRKYSDNPVRYCYNELTELLEMWNVLTNEEQDDVLTQFEPVLHHSSSRHLTAG